MIHLVNKLEFEATCANESIAFEVRHNFARICQDHVSGIIEDICTRLAGEDEWLQIDKLEIDLGHIDPVIFESTIRQALYLNFEKQLLTRLQSQPTGLRKMSKPLADLEMLTFFLREGILPWWADATTKDPGIICLALLSEQQHSFYNLLQENKSNENFWKRISLQFSSEVKNQIIHLFDQLTYVEKEMLQFSTELLAAGENVVWAGSDDLLKRIQTFILARAATILAPGNQAGTQSFSTLVKSLCIEWRRSFLPGNPGIAEDHFNELPEPSGSITRQEFDFTSNSNDPVEKLLTGNAGIVLLSPFFKPLFAELGWIEELEWKDEASQQKAIHLLRYISSGELKTPEYTLGLEKILCGMPLFVPVTRESALNDKEISEAETLLKSVTGHWKALKNASISALRQTFLKRDGIITRKDDGWHLQVERRTEDILLESIPWGFSTISFSWNKYIIYVEW